MKQKVWLMLSELFVDTQHTEDDLRRLGKALNGTGYSVKEIERIFKTEVSPVCGKWMCSPGAIGPWPMFDEEDLNDRIQKYLQQPWYQPPFFNNSILWRLPSVRRDWKIVKGAIHD